MKTEYLIVVWLFSAAVASKPTEKEKSCADFALDHKVLTSPNDIEWCEKFFKDQKAKFRRSFEENLGCELKDLKSAEDFWVCNPECFMKTFDDYRISDLYMKGWISHLHSGLDDSESYSMHVENTRKVVYENIGMSCIDSRTTPTLLQMLFDQAGEMSESTKYCLRRYAVEKQLINSADYGFDLPNSTSHDCEFSFEELDERLSDALILNRKPRSYFGVSGFKIRDCETEHEIIKTNSYEKSSIKFLTIATFDLSSVQKLNLANQMMDAMKSFGNVVLKCMKDYCVENCHEY